MATSCKSPMTFICMTSVCNIFGIVGILSDAHIKRWSIFFFFCYWEQKSVCQRLSSARLTSACVVPLALCNGPCISLIKRLHRWARLKSEGGGGLRHGSEIESPFNKPFVCTCARARVSSAPVPSASNAYCSPTAPLKRVSNHCMLQNGLVTFNVISSNHWWVNDEVIYLHSLLPITSVAFPRKFNNKLR